MNKIEREGKKSVKPEKMDNNILFYIYALGIVIFYIYITFK